MRLRLLSCSASLVALCAIGAGLARAGVTASPVRHVRVGRISIGYRRVGTGPPLVMITGFGATLAEWDPELVSGLAARRTVIVFDNRGVATSTDTPHDRLTIDEMANDTNGLIRRLGYRRADVLGWSMGSFIAQELALRHPAVVRRLILSGADPGGPRAVQASARVNAILADPNTTPAQLVALLFPRNQQKAGFAYLGRVGSQAALLPESFTVSPRILAQQNIAEGRRWYCRGCGAYPRLPRIAARTLVADGNEDIVEPPANSRIIAARIPGARLRLFHDAGHAFMFQYNRTFARVATAFLTAR